MKTLFKQRGTQWTSVSKKVKVEDSALENVNFIWTQNKRQHVVEAFEKHSTQASSKLLSLRVYGKIENNFHLSNKKALFLNMKSYYEAI